MILDVLIAVAVGVGQKEAGGSRGPQVAEHHPQRELGGENPTDRPLRPGWIEVAPADVPPVGVQGATQDREVDGLDEAVAGRHHEDAPLVAQLHRQNPGGARTGLAEWAVPGTQGRQGHEASRGIANLFEAEAGGLGEVGEGAQVLAQVVFAGARPDSHHETIQTFKDHASQQLRS